MRKLLSFLLIFNLAHATAPTGYKNETASSKTYAQDLVFPNNQLTKQAGLNSRIETGNANILVNPSFEHTTFNTGWTNNSGSVSQESTNYTDGKKAYKILSSSIGTDVYQLSTLNASNLKGQLIKLSVNVNTADPLTQVCAIVNSTDTNCVTVPVTTVAKPFRRISMEFTGGATNNGIRIKSSTTTANIITYIDDAYIGVSSKAEDRSYVYASGSSFDMSISNSTIVTSPTGSSFTLNNIKEGSVYTLAFQDTSSTITPSFTMNKEEDGSVISGSNIIYSPPLVARNSGKQWVASFTRMGSYVYVNWQEF